MKKFIFLLLCIPASLFAQDVSIELESFNRPIADSIFIDKDTVKPGDEFSVTIALQIKDDWKVYWKTSGGISIPMAFSFTLPEGVTQTGMLYPYPKYLFDPATKLVSYINKGDAAYTATFKVGENVPKGKLNFQLQVDWQACKDNGQCIQDFSAGPRDLSISIGDVSVDNPAGIEARDKAQKYFPKATPTGWKIHAFKTKVAYKVEDDTSPKPAITVTIVAPQAIDPLKIQFFSENVAFGKQNNHYSFKAINPNTVQRTYEINSEVEAKDVPTKISGVITIEKSEGKFDAFKISGEVNETKFKAEAGQKYRTVDDSPPVKSEDSSFWFILVLAFFGGLILNLMPCVFPVLSLKVMSFVNQAQEGKSSAVKHSLIFTLGALLSFWALAGSMLIIKAVTGTNVDWGYQLQKPAVVLGLILVLFIMALNLFGLFEIGVGLTGAGQSVQQKKGMSGSFFSGVLATVVATPCMAPMLGAALTYAFTQSAFISMIIFTFICLGMCSPYIVLAMSPRLLKLVPKPGAWMETFKQSMGFLMMLAVVWLLHTLQKQMAHADYLFNVLWGFIAIAVACWIYGKYCPMYLKRKVRIRGFIAVLFIGGFGLWYSFAKLYEKPALDWVPFDVAVLEKHRKDGTPVFIDFTATWCATCQVNKKVAMYPNAALFQKKGVITMKADATKENPLISAWLAEYGSKGVPMNLLYDGKNPLPIKFPELITAGTMENILTRLPEKEKEKEADK